MDHLPRHLRREWRQVAAAIDGQHEPWVVADLVDAVTARKLRKTNLTWVLSLEEPLREAWRTGSTTPVEEALAMVSQADRTGVGACFVDAARTLAALGAPPLGDMPDPLVGLTRLAVALMPRKLCYAYLEPALSASVFTSHAEYLAYIGKVEAATKSDVLADKLFRDGRQTRVTKPPTRHRQSATADLLHQTIEVS
jgi:hypothetical protein